MLCAGNRFFSKLIRHATKSPWSHVGFIIKVKDANDYPMVFESVEDIGVQAVPLSSYFNDYNGSKKPYDGYIAIKRHKDYHDGMTKQLSIKAWELLGHKYDWMEILRITRRILFKKGHSEIEDDGLYICSEYAYECYKSVGIIIPHNKDGFISPGDFGRCKEFEGIL